MTQQSSSSRLAFLDGLRGIAILMVLLAHSIDSVVPAFKSWQEAYFQLGRAGVYLFFLCSGFIIPISIERHGSLRRFWVSRFFRLYPMYWFCMAGVVLFSMGMTNEPVALLANFAMVPLLLGLPLLWPIFWSLSIEILFYACVSVFFRIGILRHTIALTVSVIVIGWLLEGGLWLLGRPVEFEIFSNLALMFVGTVFYRYFYGTISKQMVWAIIALALLLLSASVFWQPPSMLIARLVALAIFGSVLSMHRRRIPNMLIYIGQISYSIYLLHLFVLALIPKTSYPVITIIIWFLCIMLLASITYRFIERPMIALGHDIVRKEFSPQTPPFQTVSKRSGRRL
jgi:peptidoglycan/LPS O-acetylase OafA/YrhL